MLQECVHSKNCKKCMIGDRQLVFETEFGKTSYKQIYVMSKIVRKSSSIRMPIPEVALVRIYKWWCYNVLCIFKWKWHHDDSDGM